MAVTRWPPASPLLQHTSARTHRCAWYSLLTHATHATELEPAAEIPQEQGAAANIIGARVRWMVLTDAVLGGVPWSPPPLGPGAYSPCRTLHVPQP